MVPIALGTQTGGSVIQPASSAAWLASSRRSASAKVRGGSDRPNGRTAKGTRRSGRGIRNGRPRFSPAQCGATGDPSFQELWTLLHAPTITLPLHTGPNGLPVGVQLAEQRHRDDDLLQIANWLMTKATSV
jgi:Asp-tRNA(Asn)/Glu-tRNA(Gln) amidotransferase A subunit family amidase